ncbi:MAG: ribokinase [Ilumatobacteraceae bacterium]
MSHPDRAACDVCVVGSTNLDLVATAALLPSPGETVMGRDYAEHPGGKGLNQAVAAARAGASTVFVSAVGDDAAGAGLLQVMRDEGIDTTSVAVVTGVPTGRAIIGVGDSGDNFIIVVSGANMHVQVDQVPASAHVVLSQLEVPFEAIERAFTQARALGAITVLNPAPAAAHVPASMLALTDIVVPNEHEVGLLGGVDALLAQGVGHVVVTLGDKGAEVHHRDGSVEHIDAFAVNAVDTTGAGDTFCGTLSARLALGDDLPAALRHASAAAAISTTRAGAVPSIPTADEVDALLSAGA